MARKKDELGAREKTIHFRVSEAFYEVIAHEARQCGLSLTKGNGDTRLPVGFLNHS